MAIFVLYLQYKWMSCPRSEHFFNKRQNIPHKAEAREPKFNKSAPIVLREYLFWKSEKKILWKKILRARSILFLDKSWAYTYRTYIETFLCP